eukprot:7094563-Prymnesium_polylepis.1
MLRRTTHREALAGGLPDRWRASLCRRESGPEGPALAQWDWGGTATAQRDAGTAYEPGMSAQEACPGTTSKLVLYVRSHSQVRARPGSSVTVTASSQRLGVGRGGCVCGS